MSDEPLRPWTVRSSSYRVDEPFLRVRSDTVELPDGTVIEGYFVRESRGFAIVAALTPERRIVLVRQYKHGIGQIVLELPAGMIDAGESPDETAPRELTEETGFSAGRLIALGELRPNPSFMNNRCFTFLAEDLSRVGATSLDELEELESLVVGSREVEERMGTGELVNALTFVALALYRRYRTERA